jgi:hypothetical protein
MAEMSVSTWTHVKNYVYAVPTGTYITRGTQPTKRLTPHNII